MRTNRNASGFTLLELMVVLLILAMLASIAVPRVTSHLSKAKVQAARMQTDALGAAVESFLVDVGRLPTQEEGLDTLVTRPQQADGWNGPYLKKRASLVDPWQRPFLYRVPGQHGDFDVYSLGADGKEGGDGDAADVGSW